MTALHNELPMSYGKELNRKSLFKFWWSKKMFKNLRWCFKIYKCKLYGYKNNLRYVQKGEIFYISSMLLLCQDFKIQNFNIDQWSSDKLMEHTGCLQFNYKLKNLNSLWLYSDFRLKNISVQSVHLALCTTCFMSFNPSL